MQRMTKTENRGATQKNSRKGLQGFLYFELKTKQDAEEADYL